MPTAFRVLPWLIFASALAGACSATDALPSGQYLLTMTPASKQFRDQSQDLVVVVESRGGKITMESTDKMLRERVKFTVNATRSGVVISLESPFARVDFTGKRAEDGRFTGKYRISPAKDRPVPEEVRDGTFVLGTFDEKNPPRDYVLRTQAAGQALAKAMVVMTLRALATECEMYRVREETYPARLADLGKDGHFAQKLEQLADHGYAFTYKRGGADSWTVKATPTRKGLPHYFLDSTGVLRHDPKGPAHAKSPSVD